MWLSSVLTRIALVVYPDEQCDGTPSLSEGELVHPELFHCNETDVSGQIMLKICVSLQRPDVIVGCLKYWNELEETLRVWNSLWFYMWNQQNKKARITFRQFYLKTCCGYSLESPCRGDSNEYPQHTFLWRNKQNYPLIITKYPPYLFHCIWCLFWLGFQAFMVIVNVPLICWLDGFYKQWKVRWPY